MMETIETEKRLWGDSDSGFSNNNSPTGSYRQNNRQRKPQQPPLSPSRSISGSSSSEEEPERNRAVTLRDLYSLRQVLSDTSNGTVFSGRRRRDGRAVAIKRIMRNRVKRWGIVRGRQVPMEVALLRRVNEKRHSGIVEVLEWFECADCFLVVMARPTPVMDLFDYVSKRKRLTEKESQKIMLQIIDSIEHCQNRAVFHRDVKLENILIVPTNLQTTLIDFGCGAFAKEDEFNDFAGTPQYYPPEWFLERRYNGHAQTVWACGVLLYSLVTGRLPFASTEEICARRVHWPDSVQLTSGVKNLIESMLDKNPKRRINLSQVKQHPFLAGSLSQQSHKQSTSKLRN